MIRPKTKTPGAAPARQAKPPPVRTLTLIRHAKSSWKYDALADQDRPLNARGVRDAALMGAVLAERGFAPERLTSSPALRALRTAEAACAGIDYPDTAIVLDRGLYHAGADGLLDRLHRVDDRLTWIAWVGHNPGLNELVHRLVTGGPANIPTAGIVELRLAARRWKDIGQAAVIDWVFDMPGNHP